MTDTPPSIDPEEVEKAADSLSNKFEENIAWYKRNADRARQRHYQTMTILILLSGITPILVSLTAAVNSLPDFLKWIAAVTTAATGVVIWIRAVWNYQHKWRTFWASYVALMSMRRRYKFDRARLGGI